MLLRVIRQRMIAAGQHAALRAAIACGHFAPVQHLVALCNDDQVTLRIGDGGAQIAHFQRVELIHMLRGEVELQRRVVPGGEVADLPAQISRRIDRGVEQRRAGLQAVRQVRGVKPAERTADEAEIVAAHLAQQVVAQRHRRARRGRQLRAKPAQRRQTLAETLLIDLLDALRCSARLGGLRRRTKAVEIEQGGHGGVFSAARAGAAPECYPPIDRGSASRRSRGRHGRPGRFGLAFVFRPVADVGLEHLVLEILLAHHGLGYVVKGNHAQQRIVLHHRDVAHAGLQHGAAQGVEGGFGAADFVMRVHAFGHDVIAQHAFALGDRGHHFRKSEQSDELAVRHDHQRADVMLGHGLHRLQQAGFGRHGKQHMPFHPQNVADFHGVLLCFFQ